MGGGGHDELIINEAGNIFHLADKYLLLTWAMHF